MSSQGLLLGVLVTCVLVKTKELAFLLRSLGEKNPLNLLSLASMTFCLLFDIKFMCILTQFFCYLVKDWILLLRLFFSIGVWVVKLDIFCLLQFRRPLTNLGLSPFKNLLCNPSCVLFIVQTIFLSISGSTGDDSDICRTAFIGFVICIFLVFIYFY
ncbi:unnamed protein product [Moneuplotes crassus]|uniref:Uncharacterized protein n=1 Tax=Euplotes crassus TaxID=5936 RepID=A0AAD1XDY6_EUPCR|nr:unnamed protein product [Moneuplotes crassus]